MNLLETCFSWLLGRENITFLIALVGFVISIYNFAAGIMQNRVRLKVEIAAIFRADDRRRCIDVIHLKIINLSRAPVVLSRVTVSSHLGTFQFGSEQWELLTTTLRTGGAVVRKRGWNSDYLPVKIEGNGYANLLLKADQDVRTIAKTGPNEFLFYTDRKIIRKQHLFSEFTDYGKIERCREPSWSTQE